MLKMPSSTQHLDQFSENFPANISLFKCTFSFGRQFFLWDHNTICLDDFVIKSEIDKLRCFNFIKDTHFGDLNEALVWYIENQTDYDPKNIKHNNLPEIDHERTILSFSYSGINDSILEEVYVESKGEGDIKNFLECTQDGVFSIEEYHLEYQNHLENIKRFKAFSFDIEIGYKEIISHDIFDGSE